MKRIALILAFALSAAFTSAAQEKPKTDTQSKPETPKAEAPKGAEKTAALPTADEILDKNVKAVGGKEVIEKIASRSTKASFDLEAFGVSGAPIEILAKAPNKSATKIDVPNFGVVNIIFNGATGWNSDPMNGLRELTGVELAQLKRRSDLHGALNLKQQYSKMEVKGKAKVGSYETYVIEATTAEGGLEKFYFDINTGLLVRHDLEAEGPQGKALTENYFDDYKAVDGVKIPHTIRFVNPEISWVTKIIEVKNNVEIDDAKFNKPSN